MSDTEADVRQSTNRYFKDHLIVELSRDGEFGSWRCSKNGSCHFSFTITVIPGSLILTGDLGNLIVTRHGTQMIPWCRGSVDSTSYFAEKTGDEFTTLEFSFDTYRAWLKERVAEHTTKHYCEDDSTVDDTELDLVGQHYQEILDNGVDLFTELEAYESLHADHEDDHEGGVFWQDWNRQFLVKRDEIRWFVMNYVEPKTEGGGA